MQWAEQKRPRAPLRARCPAPGAGMNQRRVGGLSRLSSQVHARRPRPEPAVHRRPLMRPRTAPGDEAILGRMTDPNDRRRGLRHADREAEPAPEPEPVGAHRGRNAVAPRGRQRRAVRLAPPDLPRCGRAKAPTAAAVPMLVGRRQFARTVAGRRRSWPGLVRPALDRRSAPGRPDRAGRPHDRGPRRDPPGPGRHSATSGLGGGGSPDAVRPRRAQPRPPSRPASVAIEPRPERERPGADARAVPDRSRRPTTSSRATPCRGSRPASTRPSRRSSKLNGLKSPYVIHPGQVLKLPSSQTPRAPRRQPAAGSALAAPAERRHEAAGADLADPRSAARARLATLVVDRQEVADLGLEGRRDSIAAGPRSPCPASPASPHGARRPPRPPASSAAAERQQPCRVQDLVAVGIADARDEVPGS